MLIVAFIVLVIVVGTVISACEGNQEPESEDEKKQSNCFFDNAGSQGAMAYV